MLNLTPDTFLLWERDSRDTIDFKRCYFDMTGDTEAALLLSQIVYYFLPDRRGKRQVDVVRYDAEWIARQRTDWWEECRLRAKRFDRAMKILKDRGLVDTRTMIYQNVTTLHITILWPRFLAAWEHAIQSPAASEEELDNDSGIPKTGNLDFQQTTFGNSQNGKSGLPAIDTPDLLNLEFQSPGHGDSGIPVDGNTLSYTKEIQKIDTEENRREDVSPPPPPTQQPQQEEVKGGRDNDPMSAGDAGEKTQEAFDDRPRITKAELGILRDAARLDGIDDFDIHAYCVIDA